MKTKIILVDDHKIVRDGLKLVLGSVPEFEIIGEGGDGNDAIALVSSHKPDILISDISMPNLNGLEAVEKIKKQSPETKVLFLSMFDKPEYVKFAVKVGADGYILKDADKEEMIKAIKKVVSGEKYFSGDVSGALIDQFSGISNAEVDKTSSNLDHYNLTKREAQILDFIVEGKSNKDIADSANISIRTIETHRLNIMKKMKVNSASDLVRLAMQAR